MGLKLSKGQKWKNSNGNTIRITDPSVESPTEAYYLPVNIEIEPTDELPDNALKIDGKTFIPRDELISKYKKIN